MGHNRSDETGNNNDVEQILDALPDGAALINSGDGKFVLINRAFATFVGYEKDELLRLSLYDLLPKNGTIDREGLLKKLPSGDGETSGNIPLVTKGGTVTATDAVSTVIQFDGMPHIIVFFRKPQHEQAPDASLNDEKQILAVIDNSPFGAHTYELTSSGALVLTGANRSADIILGINHSLRIGLTIEEAFPPLAETDIPSKYREVILTGRDYQEIQVSYADDGISGAFDIHAFQTGHNRMTVFFQDITERKKSEEALRRNQELLKTILDTVSNGILLVDNEKNIIHYNRRFIEMWNIPDEVIESGDDNMVLSHVLDMFDDPKGFINTVEYLYSNDLQNLDEIRFRDGSVFERFTSPLISNGTKLGRIWDFRDISGRKRMENELKNSEALLRTMFEASPAGIFVLKNRVPMKVNRSLCRITGYSEDELVGINTRHLYFNDEEYDRVGRAYGDMNSEGISMIEARFRKKDGSDLNVLVCLSRINPEKPEDGDIAVTLDITELKRVEAEKLHLEEMLLHSQKIESIGRLAGGIAHDFNNLLTAITGNTEMAMRELDPESRPYSRLAVIKKAAEGAVNLTRQLLAYSRKQVIEPKIINLNELIEQMNKMLLTLLGENIRLTVLLTEPLSPVKADPGQIEQVIVNLATNARDAMPNGGVLTIETSCACLDDTYTQAHPDTLPGRYAMMAITDTGTGMSSDTLDSAFEPFFTTKEKGHGTGLGLSTVYGIVKQNGGSVEVYSEPGRGTVFKVYFPASLQPETDSRRNDEKPVPSTGCETVLIIEDNHDVLKFTGEILSQAGYRVLTAASGEEGIAVSENYTEKIDLVLTDVILPGINGRVTAEQIRSARPGVKILYNSGYTAEVIDKQGVLEKGINFISKPYTSQELTSKVREIIDRK